MNERSWPAYLDLLESGELQHRAIEARRHLQCCDLCARYCRVDRTVSLDGVVCRTGSLARVDGFGPHHGEEDPLRGANGSGTIFFSWCNLRCVFCQNWEISQRGRGQDVSAERLAGMMLELQAIGCHNINLVSPSHVVAQILAALVIAASRGLRLPLVYNTGGYDSLEALTMLDGVIDIYMPDIKYGHSDAGHRYSHARSYAESCRTAVKEMHRQVGDLEIGYDGVARRGLLVRHLVLRGDIAGTAEVMAFLANEVSRNTYLNVMDQYRPCHRAWDYDELARRPTEQEYREALRLADAYGLCRIDVRRRF